MDNADHFSTSQETWILTRYGYFWKESQESRLQVMTRVFDDSSHSIIKSWKTTNFKQNPFRVGWDTVENISRTHNYAAHRLKPYPFRGSVIHATILAHTRNFW